MTAEPQIIRRRTGASVSLIRTPVRQLPSGCVFRFQREAYFTGRAIIWDKDSTLADTRHRHHMIDAIRAGAPGAPTWDDYSLACTDDAPIEGTRKLMQLLARDHLNIVVSGAADGAGYLISLWLQQHEFPVDQIILRADGDSTPNEEFKTQVIRRLQEQGLLPVLAVEDYEPAARAIREELHLPVLGVTAFYPDLAVQGRSL